MAEKNTHGAVHLTSLSLDLTQFNENIQQIKDATAQAADEAVQNFAKMREELNRPLESMMPKANTQQFTQSMNEATQSVQKFAETAKSELGSLSDTNIDALLKGLNVPFSKEDESRYQQFRTTLQSLRDELAELGIEYKKIQVTTKDGDLFRAVVESSDEAGRTIQNTFNLAEGSVENLGTKIVEKSAQSARALKEQSVSADVLRQKFSDLSKVADALATKFSNADMQLKFPEVAEQASRFKEEVKKVSAALENNELDVQRANQVYDNLWKTQSVLAKTWNDITRQAKESSASAAIDADRINNLALKYANLAKQIQSSKVSDDTGMKALANDAKQAEQKLKELAEQLKNGDVSVKEATESYKKLDSELIKMRTQFADTGFDQKELVDTANRADKLSKSYADLQAKLERLIATMQGQKFDSPELSSLVSRAQELSSKMSEVSSDILSTGYATEGAEKTFRNFDIAVSNLNADLQKAKGSFNEYQKSLAPIEQQAKQTVSSLKVLEKSATFTTSKQKVAELRAEYEQFINKLKNTHVGTDEAERELAELQQRFTELEGTIKTGHTWLENWVNKISESAKWQIANSALNLIRRSFGDLTGTIIETENSVIELQRVLNDKSLSNSAITDELYQIAYQYGQTFDAVQETAVKFAQTGMEWSEVVDATRATMLGLNTAELEVTTATEGLIAVMAQFGVDAKDLESVIDKINKTADNFPVTSEKIVAALQRAGGTAQAFGLSLEETIGIITALGEATGRAGEAIGTAMNSLISFSMKDTSLAKFSEFLGKDVSDYGVLDLWKELSAAIKSAGDEGEAFAKKMATSEEFTGLMNEELASAIGLTDEYNKATEETNQMLKDGKDIYSVVGTYRQNYFIALLNNIDTAIAAIQNMGDAVGYSMRENETAMEAFSKKWNQLVISAKELAIQFGEAGFLDIMKGFVSAADYALQLTKAIGGLQTVMVGLSAIFFTVKSQKVADIFQKLISPINGAKNAISIYRAYLETGATASQAMAAATNTMKAALGGTVGVIGLVVTALTVAIGAWKNYKEAQRQAIEDDIQSGKEAVASISNLTKAYNEYKEVLDSSSSSEETVAKSRENMISLLGKEANDIDVLISRNKGLVEGYEDVDSTIKTLTESEYNLAKAMAEQRLEAVKAKIANAEVFSEKEIGNYAAHYLDLVGYTSQLYADMEKNNYELFRNVKDILTTKASADTIVSDIQDLDEAIEWLNKRYESGEKSADDFWKAVLAKRQELGELNGEFTEASEAVSSLGENLDEYAENQKAAAEATEKLDNSTSELTTSFEDIEKVVDTLNKKMDSFQSAIKTVHDVVEQYNKTGVMTADMLQSLIELAPEYIDLIDINSNSLSVNQEKLESLMQVNDNYMIQLAAMKIQKEYEALATELQKEEYDNLTEAEIRNMIATQSLGGTIYQAAMQFLTGKTNSEQFRKAIEKAGEQAGLTAAQIAVLAGNITGLATSMNGFLTTASMAFTGTFSSNLLDGKTFQEWNDMFNKKQIDFATYQKYYNRYQQGKFDTVSTSSSSSGLKTWMPSTSSSSKSSGGSSSDPYKAEKDSLNELLDVYEHSIYLIEKNEKTSQSSADKIVAIYRKMQEAVHAQAEKYRAAGVSENDSMIRDLQKQWWQYEEKIEEVLDGLYDEIVKVHKNAINVLEHEYESAEQRLDYSYMGENLKKQLDYQVKIQKEAERELERLAKLGMDANSDAAQDVINTWYDAEKAIREIGQKIAADILDPFDDFIDLADHFELWEYMDFTKVDYLRDKLAALNKLLEDGTISAKEYSAQLKSISYAIYTAQKELYEQEKQTVSNNLKNVTEGYKAQQDALKKQKDQLNDYYDTLIDGYNKEIDAWNKKKEQVEDYYDTLIDNLRDVEKANERINKQVDYYNSRQKIITNLEQAQARSGVEWREKEMEYQQQLIDLDEEWRRTLEEWSIEDQITALEKLKESAIADIDLSIQKIRDTITMTEKAKKAAIDAIEAEIDAINDLITAAEEAAEAEIQVINDKIAEMSKFIAESIKNGTVDGLVDSREEFDKALVDGTNAMLDFIDNGKNAMIDGAEQTANGVYGIYYTDFISPMNESISDIASTMATSIASGAEQGAKQALSTFQTSFITPLKNQMASLMKDVQTANTTIANASTTSTVSAAKKLTKAQQFAFNSGAGPVAAVTPSITSKPSFNADLIKNPMNNIYITNINRGVEDAASKTQRTLAALGYK